MQDLANQTGERVYLAVPYREEVLYLEAMYPADSVELMRSILGERAQMYCTGLGKAMLANMGEQEIKDYLEGNTNESGGVKKRRKRLNVHPRRNHIKGNRADKGKYPDWNAD